LAAELHINGSPAERLELKYIAMLKQQAVRLVIRLLVPRLLRDPNPFNRLLGQATLVQYGRIPEEKLREELDTFYAGMDAQAAARDIDLSGKAERLNRPGGYKTDILGLTGDASGARSPGRFDLWARRFRLLRHLGIRSDVLIVRAGEQIPPHGHSRVVSGFYVMEGKVAIRHYDRVEELPEHVLLRKVIDTELGPGGYTTNSEYHHNIHWLRGIAPASYLFRFTVTGVPVRPFSASGGENSRIYVDPTVAPEASGLIRAPFISDQEAKKVVFQ
jgi:hypothetical protein